MNIQEDHRFDYPDTAMPIIGIIAKMCIQITKFRREISKEANVYCLLLRALLLFYQHTTFKQDCAVALFILAHSEYAIGSLQITMPILCKRLRVPFKLESHWHNTPFNKKSDLEQLLFAFEEPDDKAAQSAWQYVRLTFASLWFNGFDQILGGTVRDNDTRLDYSINGEVYLAFDESLCLTKTDMSLIQATTVSYALNHWLQVISNATNHIDVNVGISAITNYAMLPDCVRTQLNHKDLIVAIRRFCSATPNTLSDETVFEAVLQLLTNLVEKGLNFFFFLFFNKICILF